MGVEAACGGKPIVGVTKKVGATIEVTKKIKCDHFLPIGRKWVIDYSSLSPTITSGD